MNYIKSIRTPSGDKQIDYRALANLPEKLLASNDESGNIVCDNGLKLFKDFTMQGWTYTWVDDESHENGGYYLYTAIEGPFSPIIKITEARCGLSGNDCISEMLIQSYLILLETK